MVEQADVITTIFVVIVVITSSEITAKIIVLRWKLNRHRYGYSGQTDLETNVAMPLTSDSAFGLISQKKNSYCLFERCPEENDNGI